MYRLARLAAMAILITPVAAMAQIHGQRPDMRQDLHLAPGAAAAGGGQLSPQAPQTRTQQLRQQSRAVQQQQRRADGQRQQAATGQASRMERTGTGTPAARTPDAIAAQEARMAEARRRQAAAQERAARAQPGVR